MLTEDQLDDLACSIVALGYEEGQAMELACFIGDTPTIDADGNIVVQKNGKVIATLPASILE